jgi:hypothetical protein
MRRTFEQVVVLVLAAVRRHLSPRRIPAALVTKNATPAFFHRSLYRRLSLHSTKATVT